MQYIKREDVKVSCVPQIEGLAVNDFLDYARNKSHLLEYLPVAKNWLHLDKKWICDQLYTRDTEGVQKMIDDAMKVRKQKLEEKQDLLVDVRPEFAAALSTSFSFSSKLHFTLTHYRAEGH